MLWPISSVADLTQFQKGSLRILMDFKPGNLIFRDSQGISRDQGSDDLRSLANIIVGRFDPISTLSLQRALGITCTKSSHILLSAENNNRPGISPN